jgi:hypothetical protein
VADWRALDETAVLRTAQTLLSAEPWLMSASLPEAAARLGWSVTYFDPEYPDLGALLDSGRGLGPKSGFFTLDEQSIVQEVSATLTERVAADGAEAESFKQDVFAAAASTLTGAYGRPARRVPGEEPQVWWQRPATMLGLVTEDDTVSLQLSPSELMVGEWS